MIALTWRSEFAGPERLWKVRECILNLAKTKQRYCCPFCNISLTSRRRQSVWVSPVVMGSRPWPVVFLRGVREVHLPFLAQVSRWEVGVKQMGTLQQTCSRKRRKILRHHNHRTSSVWVMCVHLPASFSFLMLLSSLHKTPRDLKNWISIHVTGIHPCI